MYLLFFPHPTVFTTLLWIHVCMHVHTYSDASSPVLFQYYKLCFFRHRDASEVDVEKCGLIIVQNCVMS
jgi:hypothetical protein